MTECIETSNRNNQKFMLNNINENIHYFIEEVKERELMSKRLIKYIASFDYFDKFLIFLSATSRRISIASFATIIRAPVGIASTSLSLTFSLSTGLVNKLLKIIRMKKKKHNKTVVSARSKLNSIESKIFNALMNNQISHNDFMTIINEEKNYRKLKETIRIVKGQEYKKVGID